MTSQPTLINLPPPPSDPVTPSDVPSRSGTPNSTTTSMSELSTVAIKDGHRGHLPHHHSHHHTLSSASNSGVGAPGGSSGAHPPTSAAGQLHMRSQLDAERADRISRLAGLERVNTVRGVAAQLPPPGSAGNLTPGAAAPPQIAQTGPIGSGHYAGASGYAGGAGGAGGAAAQQVPATVSYFDSSGNPAIVRERSTVGSASATGSVGARTTWAGSEADTGDFVDADKMSESQDMEMDGTASSVGGMSEDDGAATTGSLVGFGEGARTPARQSLLSSPGGVGGTVGTMGGNTPSGSKGGTPTPPGAMGTRDAAMTDGLTYDRAGVDTAAAAAAAAQAQAQTQAQTDEAVRANMNTTSNDRMMRGG